MDDRYIRPPYIPYTRDETCIVSFTTYEVNADSGKVHICRQLRMTSCRQEYAEEGGEMTAHSVQQSLQKPCGL